MGILLSSSVFFAIHGVLYPASITMNCASSNLPVTLSYTASHATLSLTLPAVTSTASTIPFLSQAVCASYANCRSCSPFTNMPQSGSVVETVFSAVPPPLGSSSLSSIGGLPSSALSAFTSFRSCSSYIFAVLATCSFWNFFLFALAFICVPSMNTALGSTARLFIALFSMCSNISAGSSEGNLLQNA